MNDLLNIGLLSYPFENKLPGVSFLKHNDPGLYGFVRFLEAIATSLVLPNYIANLDLLESKSLLGDLALADGYRFFQSVIPYSLSDSFDVTKQAFPFLNIEKTGSAVVYNRYGKQVVRSSLVANAVLAPMDVRQFAVLNHTLDHIAKSINSVILIGEFSDFDGITNSTGIDLITLGRSDFGSFRLSDKANVFMPCCSMTFEMDEVISFSSTNTSEIPGVIKTAYQLSSILDDDLKLFDQHVDLNG